MTQDTVHQGPGFITSQELISRSANAEDCVLPQMLDRQAARIGGKTLFKFDRGPSWSYAETRQIARGTAAAFEALGVERGDRVLVFLGDGPDIVRISLGLCYLGAVMAPINPELQGDVLRALIDYAATDLLVTTSALLERLPDADFARLSRVIVLEGPVARREPRNLTLLPSDALAPRSEPPAPLDPALQPWDVHTLFFTSGTTGVSKAVESTHAHCAAMAIDGLRFLKEDDTFCTPCGYFHVGGAYAPWAVIRAGASILIVGKFSASRFMDQMREHGVTTALLIGVMCDFLMAQPARADDAATPLESVVSQPLPSNLAGFTRRFGLSVYTQYDQTETPPLIQSPRLSGQEILPRGYCGELRPGFAARIVDENDIDVPDGTTGELIVRCDAPWVIATGYFEKPQETARAWRNGWFHTGDMFQRDALGRFSFIDRSKDVIRRRGENISSFDIERTICQHPAVDAAAAFGVESEYSEQDVMVVVQLHRDGQITPAELSRYMESAVASFMAPRYFRFVAELPRSATDKIQKFQLQCDGITPDTWDRLGGTASFNAAGKRA